MRRIALLAAVLLSLCGQLRARAGDLPEVPPPIDPNFNQPLPATTGSLCWLPPPYEPPLNRTYFSADLVGFRRDGQPRQAIATLDTPTSTVLRTNDLNFINQPGLRLTAGRWLGDFVAIEAGFLGLLTWDENRVLLNSSPNSQGTVGNLFSPLTNFGRPAQTGLDFNNFVSIRSVSNFNTAEINLRQRLISPPGLMQVYGIYGFRYINFHERFEYRSRSLAPVGTGANNAIDVTTNNGLFGVQMGGALEFRIERRCWLNFEAKGIICQNNASQDTERAFGPTAGPNTTVELGAAKNRVAFGVDVSGSLIWKFTPAIVGRVGYQGIVVDGLALASENFVRNAPFITTGAADVYRTGTLVFHGPFTGLTVTW